MAKASWLKLRDEERAELESSFGTSGWRILSQGELPSFVPQTLRQKTVSALAITADSPTGGTYYVLSVQRVDKKDRALDIEPFGLILHSTGAAVEGVFIHHGDWRARTRPVPENLWRQLEEAGDFMWARPPDGKLQGSLDELTPPDSGAYREAVRAIRKMIDEGDSLV